METSSETNAINVLSWIFDELDTQKFGITNNQHFNYFDDSDENIQQINHFYLTNKSFDINSDDNEDGDHEFKAVCCSKKNDSIKVHPNQGETGDFKEFAKNKKKLITKEKENDANIHTLAKKFSSLESLKEKNEFKSKSINFEYFNANISLNPEDNNQLIYNSKELRKFKSDYQINLQSNNSSSPSSKKKILRNLSTSVLIPPISVPLNVKFVNFSKEKQNPFVNSSNRSLFNSNVLSDEDILTDEFPDSKLMKNEVGEGNILEKSYEENKEKELINSDKVNNSIKDGNLILKNMGNKQNFNDDFIKGDNKEKTKKSDLDSVFSSTTAVNSNISIIKESTIQTSIKNKDNKTPNDDLSLLEKKKSEKENESVYILNEYGQSLFRLRYYLLQLKYLIDCNKDLEQIVFYKLAMSQYPESNSVRTWLKRRITREPLVHGYCLPPFKMIDETQNNPQNNDIINRPLKNKIFHSLSLDKKYQVLEPLNFEFNREVMGTNEHKTIFNCNSNLKYCQMKQHNDIILRTIFIKCLFQQASDIKNLIGNERFQSLKDKALINLQPHLSKHYKTDKNISNSMISIKLKTYKKKGIYLQHHSKKASYDFSSRNTRNSNNNLLSYQPVDSINNNLHSSTYNERYEKSKSFQNLFSSNSPSKLRNCHTLTESNHKYSYSQPLAHIIFNKQNNQYNIEPLPSINSSQRLFPKEKSSFISKYIFPSNANVSSGNSYYNINKSNSNMIMNSINNGNYTNTNNSNMNISNINNSNLNVSSNNKNIKNNRSMIMNDISINVIRPSGINMSVNNGNINTNINSYSYRKHSHISSISSIKEITSNSNCYNIDNVKYSLESVSKTKRNIARNINSNGSTDFIHNDTNRKIKDIYLQKSSNSFKENDNIYDGFNQSGIINNYSDKDSVYSLSSNYDINDNDTSEKVNENNIGADSNKTLVVYQHNYKKANIIKKVLTLIKSKKQFDKKKKATKNDKVKDKNDKLNIKSNNIVDSEETINNSIEISKSYPSSSINNIDFSKNRNNNYSSDDTIHSNCRSIQNNKTEIIEKGKNIKTKKSSKWYNIFKNSKSKVRN